MSQQVVAIEEDGESGRELVIRIPLQCASQPEAPDEEGPLGLEEMLKELLKEQEPLKIPEEPSSEIEL